LQQSAQKYTYFGYISRDNVALSTELLDLMLIYYTIEQLKTFLNEEQKKNSSIGFVPTMGALHDGHLSLIEKSKELANVTVCTIFVNPTQFNNQKDLEKYPRTLDNDTKLLQEVECDVLFLPEASEIYPQNEDLETYDFGEIEHVMEGKHRPGHFNGVGLIISKFVEIINPDYAFFGEKDYQQLAIINRLVEIKKYSVKVIPCSIARAKDGLALSSRNARLTKHQRSVAPRIHQAITLAKKMLSTCSPQELEKIVHSEIEKSPELTVEYVEIGDDKYLKRATNWLENKTYRIFIAVFCGDVRLIDNEQLN
jgi:pantoate--beta-alanine ligase